jgi:pantoate--beta-alanine ligase
VRALRLACEQFARGDHDPLALGLLGRATVEAHGASFEYFAIVDPETMASVDLATPRSAAIVAARVGTTRLIDNMILGEPE